MLSFVIASPGIKFIPLQNKHRVFFEASENFSQLQQERIWER